MNWNRIKEILESKLEIGQKKNGPFHEPYNTINGIDESVDLIFKEVKTMGTLAEQKLQADIEYKKAQTELIKKAKPFAQQMEEVKINSLALDFIKIHLAEQVRKGDNLFDKENSEEDEYNEIINSSYKLAEMIIEKNK